jgi:site-specific DNA-cytosine methylase
MYKHYRRVMAGEAFEHGWSLMKARYEEGRAHSKEAWDRAMARDVMPAYMEHYGQDQKPLRDDIVAAVEYAGLGGTEEGFRRAGVDTAISVDNWKDVLMANAAFNRDSEAEHALIDLNDGGEGAPKARAKRYADLADGRQLHYHASPFCQEVSGARGSKKNNRILSWQHMNGIEDTWRELQRLLGKDNVSFSTEQSPNFKKPFLNPTGEDLRGLKRGEWRMPSEEFKHLIGMPNISAAQHGGIQTRNRAFFGDGWETPERKFKTRKTQRSIDSVMPWLKNDWQNAQDSRIDRLSRLVSEGRLGSEGLEYLTTVPSVTDSGTWRPGNRDAVWPEGLTRSKKTWADKIRIDGKMTYPEGGKISRSLHHLKPLDEVGWSQTHHPIGLTDARFFTPQERLLYNAMNPSRDLSMLGDINNPNDKNIGTALGNVVSPLAGEAVMNQVLRRLDNKNNWNRYQ